MSAARLALGTVQFGIEYGIANRTGRVVPGEVARILGLAERAGIRVLDTAIAYGDAEAVLGAVLPAETRFRIVTKVPPGTARDDVRALVRASTSRLGRAPHAVLLHDVATHTRDPGVLARLADLRDEGALSAIGVSVYRPIDLEAVLATAAIDLVQLPFSFVDRRFEPALADLRRRGVTVHARSAMLQGALTMSADELPAHLAPLAGAVEQLRAVARDLRVSPATAAAAYVAGVAEIDAVVIGVDRFEHLDAHVRGLETPNVAALARAALDGWAVEDESVVVPARWPR